MVLGNWFLAENSHRFIARDAVAAAEKAGGRILATRRLALPAEEGEQLQIAPAPCVELLVQDDGCGMSPEVLERACDPFFTTKPVGKGTGLGLSMVQGFARRSGGAFRLTSREGEGTSAAILLPAAAG